LWVCQQTFSRQDSGADHCSNDFAKNHPFLLIVLTSANKPKGSCSAKILPSVAIVRRCVALRGKADVTRTLDILEFDRMINAWHRSNEESRRLDDIPGVGPALATGLVASIADPKVFRSGREFSALLFAGVF
jgi:Transposase IS116/IS110/IS902 family